MIAETVTFYVRPDGVRVKRTRRVATPMPYIDGKTERMLGDHRRDLSEPFALRWATAVTSILDGQKRPGPDIEEVHEAVLPVL